MLGGIVWLIVTAVNYNEGFLATGGFIFERMRFKGNVWKDLIYREQSWKWVTHNYVPIKAPILKIWVHQYVSHSSKAYFLYSYDCITCYLIDEKETFRVADGTRIWTMLSAITQTCLNRAVKK